MPLHDETTSRAKDGVLMGSNIRRPEEKADDA